MTLHEVRDEAEHRPSVVSNRIEVLAEALRLAASRQPRRRCAVCGRATRLAAVFALPVTYISTCLVVNDLEASYRLLPLRHASLCKAHRDHFSALFAYVGDPHWDVARLERRAQVLGGVMHDKLLVFGGTKALKIVEEFHASVVALKHDGHPGVPKGTRDKGWIMGAVGSAVQ